MKTAMRLFLFGCMVAAFSMTGCGEQKNEAIKPEKFDPPPVNGDNEGGMADMKLDTV